MSTIRWSEYEIEANPWARKEDVEAAMLFRGVSISSWAAVETTLSEIAFRASCHQAYIEIREGFPYRLSDRLRYFKAVLDRPGPLTPYNNLARLVVARWKTGATMRHILAHGRMRVLSGPGKISTVTFTDVRPAQGGNGTLRTTMMALNDFGAGARRAARFSRLVQRLFMRLDAGDLLPQLVTDEKN